MSETITRRRALEGIGMAGASLLLPRTTRTTGISRRRDADVQGRPIVIAGQPVELRLAAISATTLRFSVLPQKSDDAELNRDGALVDFSEQRHAITAGAPMKVGDLSVSISTSPLVVRILDTAGRQVQELSIDDQGVIHFLTGEAPLLGFGEGGAQFDRRGSADAMRNGQGATSFRRTAGACPCSG
jgi:hypothetical protein